MFEYRSIVLTHVGLVSPMLRYYVVFIFCCQDHFPPQITEYLLELLMAVIEIMGRNLLLLPEGLSQNSNCS